MGNHLSAAQPTYLVTFRSKVAAGAILAGFIFSPGISAENTPSTAERPGGENINSSVEMFRGALTQAPEPQPKSGRIDLSISAGFALGRTLDYISTDQMLRHGGHERILPSSLVENKPAFAAYCAGMAAVETGAEFWLVRHQHSRIARFAGLADVAMQLTVAAHNFSVTPGPKLLSGHAPK